MYVIIIAMSDYINTIKNIDAIKGLMDIPDNSVDAVITDPPYGIAKLKSFKSSSKGTFKALDASWDVFESQDSYRSFSEAWIKECHRILKPTGSIAVWGSKSSIFEIYPILSKYFPRYLDMLTWIKRDAPPNMTQRGMAPSTEFALIFCKSETGWTFNHDDIKKYNLGKQARNYVDIQRSMSSGERAGHPTQKKIETQEFLIEMLSNPNEVVLDPFMGSGTTAAACIKLKRNYFGFEKNDEYHRLIQNRLASISNEDRELAI